MEEELSNILSDYIDFKSRVENRVKYENKFLGMLKSMQTIMENYTAERIKLFSLFAEIFGDLNVSDICNKRLLQS